MDKKESLLAPVESLGPFEHEVLMAIIRLGDDAYSVTIKEELNLRIGKDPALGTISVALSRMERRGLLRSVQGVSEEGRIGRPKRLYSLTPAGASALNRLHEQHQRLWDGLDRVSSPEQPLGDEG